MMLNEGNYRGRPVRAALGVTGTGKEQLAVEFEFIDPPGIRRTAYLFFTEGTFDRTIESLRACGWKGTDLTDFCGEQLPEGFDQEVELVIKHEEWNGRVTDRIAFINSGGGLALKTALDQNAARAFAAKLKGKIIAADQNAGRKVPATPPRAAPAAQARPAATRPAPQPQRQAEPPPVEQPPLEVLEEQAGGADVPY